VIPGKKYKPEDLIEIAWRRRWFILGPLLLISVTTLTLTQMMPNRYRSESTVLIVPPRIPKDYVKPTVTEGLQERLEAMQQQLLSRTRLERIVLDFDLYRAARKHQESMDDVLDRMATRDIKIVVPKMIRKRDEPGSFKVSFESDDPKTAMLVTERLASLFVQENIENRTSLSDTTNQFMQRQLDEALRKLQEQGAKLEAFRRTNAGRLPTEVASNLQMIQTTQQQLQALNETINRQRERQIVIERTLADESTIASTTTAPIIAGRGPAQPALSPAQELAGARQGLAALELRLKPEHPDVKAQKRRIAELEQKVAADALQQPVSDTGIPIVTSGDAAQQRRLSSLRAEYESLGRSIVVERQQADGLERSMANYRSRVEAAPTLEPDLIQLTRDYDTLQTNYTTLLQKTQAAQAAVNLEEGQVGEQFRIIDAARIPERPTSPDRVRFNLIGIVFGTLMGVGLAAFAEYRDSSLRTEDDVMVALSLPVVALVPLMWTTRERRELHRRRLLLASSAAATLMLSFAALAWKLRLFDWMR
jgi:polysaccharide chain length determinant protein (PEP-CTERM system associated)